MRSSLMPHALPGAQHALLWSIATSHGDDFLTLDAGFAADVCLAFDFPLWTWCDMAGEEKETDKPAEKSVSERIPANIFM